MINIEELWRYFLAAMISAAGGLCQILVKKDKRLLKPFFLFCELTVAAICGCMVLPITRIMGVSGDWVVLFGFGAGLSSPWLAKKVSSVFKKQINGGIDKK